MTPASDPRRLLPRRRPAGSPRLARTNPRIHATPSGKLGLGTASSRFPWALERGYDTSSRFMPILAHPPTATVFKAIEMPTSCWVALSRGRGRSSLDRGRLLLSYLRRYAASSRGSHLGPHGGFKAFAGACSKRYLAQVVSNGTPSKLDERRAWRKGSSSRKSIVFVDVPRDRAR